MNGRTSRLQTFLVRFAELKAAAGNDPKALSSFDQTTAEIRAAAKLMHDYLVGTEFEVEMFRGADKLIVHAPEGIDHSWNDFRQHWEPAINYLAMCEIDPDWPRDYNEHLQLYVGGGGKTSSFQDFTTAQPPSVKPSTIRDPDEGHAGLDRSSIWLTRLGSILWPSWSVKGATRLYAKAFRGRATKKHFWFVDRIFDDAVRA